MATILMVTSCSQPENIDLLVTNGIIYTADSAFTVVSQMAVHNGIIVATGNNLAKKYKASEILDAQGMTLVPGLIDAHCHFTGYGEGLIRWADLKNTGSWTEAIDRVKQFGEQNPDSWLLGRGWDQNIWPLKEFPDNTLLDDRFGNIPVALTRIDGHAMVANTAALKLAGIDASTQVDGGEIKLSNGKPTGLLLDNAMDLVYKAIPQLTTKQRCDGLMAAQANCLSVGLTAVADAGLEYDEVMRIDSLQKNGKIHMRVNTWLSPSNENYSLLIQKGPLKEPLLQITAIKLYADGALGSRGALLLKPYSDDSNNQGIATYDRNYFAKWADVALQNNFQLCVHAIGDSANRMILHVFAEKLGGKNDLRWRIEHAQVIDSADFDVFRQFCIIPSMQPTHATSDMNWAGNRLGNRITNAYALRRLLEQNGWMPLGTDFPIENINPFYTFYAAVARKDLNGQPSEGFQMTDALTRQQALMGMTLWAAKSLFTEQWNGSLEPGKKADFVLIDRDIMKVNETELPNTSVLATYIDGKKVYTKGE